MAHHWITQKKYSRDLNTDFSSFGLKLLVTFNFLAIIRDYVLV